MPPPDAPDIFRAAATGNLKALEIALEFYRVNNYDINEPDPLVGMPALHHAFSLP